METGEVIYEEVYASPRPPLKISFKDNGMKKLGSEVAGHDDSSQQTEPKTHIQLLQQGDLLRQNHRPVRVLRKSTNVSYLAAKAPMCLLNVQIKTKTQTKT